jgi:hypothetical protein
VQPTTQAQQEKQPTKQPVTKPPQQQQQNTQPAHSSQSQNGEQQNQQQPTNDGKETKKEPQKQQDNTQSSEQSIKNINENQVDTQKLMQQFNNYLEGCRQKLTKKLIETYHEDGQKIVNIVKEYINSNDKINFDTEIAPLVTENGKQITDKNILNDIRGRLEKYFGVKFISTSQSEK